VIELGQIIEKMLRRKNMWREYKNNLLLEEWGRVAGREISAVSRARQLSSKTLLVTVRDSTWAYHLSLLKPQLLKKLNEFAGERLVNDIFFQIGDIEATEK
jgi:predicted nucleic acid-binding Zn ribbon protein